LERQARAKVPPAKRLLKYADFLARWAFRLFLSDEITLSSKSLMGRLPRVGGTEQLAVLLTEA
jgi:hypothetical protein